MIDIEQVRVLAGIQCTLEEIAAVMKIKKRQFINRMNDDEALRIAFEEGGREGKASIRREQFRLLQAGNATMGVWLGKQYLGQRDQVGITGGDGGAIKHEIDPFDDITRELSRVAERERAGSDPPQVH